jgi:hypothetical protein
MATKQSKKKIVLPVTLADVQFELEAEREHLSSLVSAIARDVTASLIAAFNAAGGCQRCRGRGWVVIWDTLDMMDGSCAEFGPCPVPECTEETRAKSGLLAGHDSKYDYRRGVRNPLESSDAYRCVAGPIVKQIDELRSAISEIDYQRRTFVKGDRVVVVRGRKVPVGTAGRVAWVSANTGGILVKSEDEWQIREANGTWVDPRNLEKLAE